VLLRLLGMQAMLALIDRLPPLVARLATVLVLLGANAVPLVALLRGDWTAGDVLVAYWLENVAVGAWTLVRIGTARGDGPQLDLGAGTTLPRAMLPVALGGFFVVHYGMFTLTHGFFTWRLAREGGVSGGVADFAGILLVLLLSHGISTGVHWFARRERDHVSATVAMKQPYSRILVLHFTVLAAGFLTIPNWDALNGQPAVSTHGPGLVLILIKTVVDVAFHVRAHRSLAPVPRPLSAGVGA
jgi:hypothetical protein